MAFCHKIQSTKDQNKQQQQSRFSGFTKVPSTNILNESIFAPPYFQHGRPTTMFRASASNHRQHKHLTVDFAIDTRSINMLSLYKSSELQTKNNVLEYLETRPNTSSKKSYELNQ